MIEAPIGSRWYIAGNHCAVVEVGLLDASGEPAVRLHRDGDAKPERLPCPVRALLRKGIEHVDGSAISTAHAGTIPANRRRNEMASKNATRKPRAAGPKEAQARAQREAKTAPAPAVEKLDKPTAAEAVGKKPPADTGLYDALVERVKSSSPNVVTLGEKAGYVRLGIDGKSIAYIFRPTAKGVRVEVPTNTNKNGYDVIQVSAKRDVAAAMAKIDQRAAALGKKAAAA